MNTNTENLIAAHAHWQREYLANACRVRWVVATDDASRVASGITSVMLTGCCRIMEWETLSEAKAVADALNAMPKDYDDMPLKVMPYHRLVQKQLQRFEIAVQAARVADAMARQNAVAA